MLLRELAGVEERLRSASTRLASTAFFADAAGERATAQAIREVIETDVEPALKSIEYVRGLA